MCDSTVCVVWDADRFMSLGSFQVWTTCGCQTLGDYHDIYLKSDVYLLADVFENFRSTALSTYGLDPAHYFTLPGFSWDALLRTTAIELELLTDIDQHLFIERGELFVHFHRWLAIYRQIIRSHHYEQIIRWCILIADWLFTSKLCSTFLIPIDLVYVARYARRGFDGQPSTCCG